MKRENIKNSVILYQSKNIKEKLRMTHFDLLNRSIHSIKKIFFSYNADMLTLQQRGIFGLPKFQQAKLNDCHSDILMGPMRKSHSTDSYGYFNVFHRQLNIMNLNIFMSPIMLPLYQNFTTFLCLICIFIPTFIFSCAKTIPLSMMMILRPAQFDVLFLENYYTSWTDRYCPLLDRVIALLMKKVDIDPYA